MTAPPVTVFYPWAYQPEPGVSHVEGAFTEAWMIEAGPDPSPNTCWLASVLKHADRFSWNVWLSGTDDVPHRGKAASLTQAQQDAEAALILAVQRTAGAA